MRLGYWGRSPSLLGATTHSGANTSLPLRSRAVTYKEYAPTRSLAERLSSPHSTLSPEQWLAEPKVRVAGGIARIVSTVFFVGTYVIILAQSLILY